MSPALIRRAIKRGLGYFALWLILTGGDPADFVAGVVAACAATWTSLRLLPPVTSSVRLPAVGWLALRFLHQSLIAGVDVARRALDPRLPLHPGFITYPVGIEPGPERHMFTTLMSLLPGTVPTGTATTGGLLVHCLDVEQPVAAQLAEEEARFVHALVGIPGNG
jgi:multicomponent Na+:H+ antiporter subunit E